MYWKVIQVDAEVVEEVLSPQLLQKDLEFRNVDRFVECHHHVYAMLDRYGSNHSNGLVCKLLVVYADVLILQAVLMRRDAGFGHHHFVNVNDMKAIIVCAL